MQLPTGISLLRIGSTASLAVALTSLHLVSLVLPAQHQTRLASSTQGIPKALSLLLLFYYMQLDSHRQYPNMPCRRANFWACRRADEVPATLSNPTNTPVIQDWRKVRRTYLRNLRKQTRTVILLLALLEVSDLPTFPEPVANNIAGSQDRSS